jgi:heme/copper-type cytochrome/quinol oxidase subunit 2
VSWFSGMATPEGSPLVSALLLLLLSARGAAGEDLDQYNEYDGEESTGHTKMDEDVRSVLLITVAVFIVVVAFIVYVIQVFGAAPRRKKIRLKKRSNASSMRSLSQGTHLKAM